LVFEGKTYVEAAQEQSSEKNIWT